MKERNNPNFIISLANFLELKLCCCVFFYIEAVKAYVLLVFAAALNEEADVGLLVICF